jgi:hypothetical protein
MMLKNDNYETTLKPAYDNREHLWKMGGPRKATIAMAPVLAGTPRQAIRHQVGRCLNEKRKTF